MASGELTIVGGDNKLALPAHIAARFKVEDSNIITGDRTPTLSIKGKVFTITAEGETTPLMKQDEDGNEYPLASLPVVVLDYGAKMGRSYYDSAYNADEVKEPTCWSLDSITPHADVPEEVKESITAHKCSGCPMSIKGSQVTDNGKSVAACSQHRILAVVPVKRMDLPPMRLRIAQTSNYDGRSPDLKQKNLFAFQNFLDYIKARGIPHTQSIVTQLSFDPGVAYPKLMFKAVRFTDDAEIAKIDAILASGKIEPILGDNVAKSKSAPALAAPAKQAALPKPKPAPVADDDDEAAAVAALEAARARKAEAAQAKAYAEAKAAADARAEVRAKELAAQIAREAQVVPVPDNDPGDDDEEALLLKKLLDARARKAQLAGSALVAQAGPAAEAAAEPVKRVRRTKAQIEADEAAKAVGAAPKAKEEKFLPNAVNGADMGDDEGDDAPLAEAAPKATNGAKPAPKKAIEATPLAVPPDVESMLQSWDD